MGSPTKTIPVKMIVEEGGDDGLWGRVYAERGVVVVDGDNLGHLKANMQKVLQDLHNFGQEEIIWEIVWQEPGTTADDDGPICDPAEDDDFSYDDADDGPQDLFDEQDDGCGFGELD